MCIRTSWLKNKYLILVFTLNTVCNLVEVLAKIIRIIHQSIIMCYLDCKQQKSIASRIYASYFSYLPQCIEEILLLLVCPRSPLSSLLFRYENQTQSKNYHAKPRTVINRESRKNTKIVHKNEPGFLLGSEGSGADPVKDMGVHMYTQ